MTASCVYEGTIRHRRHEPVRHELSYPIALLFLDLDELPEALDLHPLWSARRPALGWFRRSDYLSAAAARAKAGTTGPVRVLTHARTFGHCFNPVSFYYCYEGDRVAAVVAEVTNTPWGERHAYVLRRERDGDGRVMQERVAKAFHVSPFMGMDHHYDWRVIEPGDELLVHIDSLRDGRRAFDATLTLRRRELSRRVLSRMLWRYPAATLVAGVRIYAHALRLKLKGAPYFPHPGRAS